MNTGLLIILEECVAVFIQKHHSALLSPLSFSLFLSLLSDCLSFFIQPCIHFDSALAADKCEMNTVSVHSLCSSLSLPLVLSFLCVFLRLDSEDLESWFSLSLFLSGKTYKTEYLSTVYLLFLSCSGDKLWLCVCVSQRERDWNITAQAGREFSGSRGHEVKMSEG